MTNKRTSSIYIKLVEYLRVYCTNLPWRRLPCHQLHLILKQYERAFSELNFKEIQTNHTDRCTLLLNQSSRAQQPLRIVTYLFDFVYHAYSNFLHVITSCDLSLEHVLVAQGSKTIPMVSFSGFSNVSWWCRRPVSTPLWSSNIGVTENFHVWSGGAQNLAYQKKAGEEDEAKQAHPSVDQDEDRKSNKVHFCR